MLYRLCAVKCKAAAGGFAAERTGEQETNTLQLERMRGVRAVSFLRYRHKRRRERETASCVKFKCLQMGLLAAAQAWPNLYLPIG